MTPCRTCAPPPPDEPDADLVRFAARIQRARRLHRAAGLALLALLIAFAIAPVAAPPRSATPASRSEWSRARRLPVQASVLWPGMCGPDRIDSPETRFALAVAGFEQCPWF